MDGFIFHSFDILMHLPFESQQPATQPIKEVLLGEWSWLGFSVTLLANLIYAVFAFALAVRIFKNESVLFRT